MCFKRKTIIVRVCAASGLLPNVPYCPIVVERRYYKGEEPKTACTVHHAPIPPDPDPVADHTLPRTGLDDYAGFTRTIEQRSKYLRDGVNAGMSVQRDFLPTFMWGSPDIANGPEAGWRHSPYKQDGWWDDRDENGNYLGTYPLFTLVEWDEIHWARYRAQWVLMAKMKIKETISVVSQCSNEEGRYYPLANNVQHQGAEKGTTREYKKMDGTIGLGGAEHTGGFFGGFGGDGGSMKDFILHLFKKVFDELTAIPGLEWEIQIGNELFCPIDANNPMRDTQEKVDTILYDWHRNIIGYLIGLGCPANKISISLAGDHVRARTSLQLQADFPGLTEELHGPNSPETLEDFIKRFPTARPDGDGFDRKAEGHTNGENWTAPSVDQAKAMRQVLILHGEDEFHTFCGELEDTNPAIVENAKWDVQRALAGKG